MEWKLSVKFSESEHVGTYTTLRALAEDIVLYHRLGRAREFRIEKYEEDCLLSILTFKEPRCTFRRPNWEQVSPEYFLSDWIDYYFEKTYKEFA